MIRVGYRRLLGGLLLLGLSTACGDGLVGSRCVDGYAQEGGSCVLVTEPDEPLVLPGGEGGSPSADGGAGGATHPPGGAGGQGGAGGETSMAGSGGGEGCAPPLLACNGACVDTTSDPDHCGACFNDCPTGLCEASSCVGAVAGHIVAIGMDFQESTPVAETLLGNAVFLAMGEPVRVLRYAEHATHGAVVKVGRVLAQQAVKRNRALEIVAATSAADVPTALAGAGADAIDVLLVHHQTSAPAGSLSATGSAWESSIATFTAGGGVIVVLASTEGTTEMADFLTEVSLFDVAQQHDITGQIAHNVGWLDALGQGVLSPLLTKKAAAAFETVEVPSENQSYVLVTDDGEPIAMHKVVASGP